MPDLKRRKRKDWDYREGEETEQRLGADENMQRNNKVEQAGAELCQAQV